MQPDLPTVIVFSILLTGFLGLLQVWLWWRDRTLVALAIWGAAELLGTLGIILLLQRGVWPHWITIQLAVGSLILANGVAWTGTRRFERQPPRPFVALAGLALWLLACQITPFYQNLACRVAAASIMVGSYQLMCMREFRRQRPGGELASRGALAVIFGVNAAMQFLRALAVVPAGFNRITYELPSPGWLGFSAIVGVVLLAGTSVLLIAVAKEEAEQSSVATLALARDAADHANRAKSRFLARMSHELRTPLNGILGAAQVLTRDARLQGELHERAALLEQAGRHLLAIINDILDLASVETGTLLLAPQPVPVAAIVQGSIDLLAATAAAKRVALTLDQAANVPPYLHADALRVRQILLNLLGNAIKFTPSRGWVTLSVVWRPDMNVLHLEVADSGRGVPAALRPHLFRDIAQRPLEMAAAEGTGLGLAISASLAQAMGGTLRYQSGPGDVGSVFTAELPLLPAVAPSAPQAAPARPRAVDGLRVLVVDDVASNRRLTEALLQQAGCSVTLAEDGASAVAALAAGDVPDVVLMDVFMPDLDGLAATRRIRGLPAPAGQVPVIALTADASPDRLPAYREAGMNDCVTKPFAVDDLLDAIGRAVASSAAAALP